VTSTAAAAPGGNPATVTVRLAPTSPYATSADEGVAPAPTVTDCELSAGWYDCPLPLTA
jgi:hypothetical protein